MDDGGMGPRRQLLLAGHVQIDVAAATGEHLPVADASADTVVFTLALCSRLMDATVYPHRAGGCHVSRDPARAIAVLSGDRDA